MTRVKDIFELLNSFAPVDLKMPEDNVGLLVGDGEAEVTKVVVALDVTKEVIAEAAEKGARLIVAHHPMPREGLKRIVAGDLDGDKVRALIQNGISSISMHTNLDKAEGGVNDALAKAIGLEDITALENPLSVGRVGYCRPVCALSEFLPRVCCALDAKFLRYIDVNRPVNKVAVGSGSGGELWKHALDAGCDTLVSGDVKYSHFQPASEMGLNLIDAGHFPSENVICRPLARRISRAFPALEVAISERHRDCIGIYVKQE